MKQVIQQLPLDQRIPALVQMIDAARARKAEDEKDEAYHMDLLAQAEAQLAGGESPGVEPSGYIEANPYVATGEEPAPAAPQGDTGSPVSS